MLDSYSSLLQGNEQLNVVDIFTSLWLIVCAVNFAAGFSLSCLVLYRSSTLPFHLLKQSRVRRLCSLPWYRTSFSMRRTVSLYSCLSFLSCSASCCALRTSWASRWSALLLPSAQTLQSGMSLTLRTVIRLSVSLLWLRHIWQCFLSCLFICPSGDISSIHKMCIYRFHQLIT